MAGSSLRGSLLHGLAGLYALQSKSGWGKVQSRALYNILGVNKQGYKEILGIYVAESEGSRFWLSVLTNLQNRGIKDILIASIDNLTGFSEAIC